VLLLKELKENKRSVCVWHFGGSSYQFCFFAFFSLCKRNAPNMRPKPTIPRRAASDSLVFQLQLWTTLIVESPAEGQSWWKDRSQFSSVTAEKTQNSLSEQRVS
jgi:hypothetical protein